MYQDGGNVNQSDEAVRAALHLNLSSDSVWSYAGTVSSDGGADEQASPLPSAQPTVSGDIPTNKPETSVNHAGSVPSSAPAQNIVVVNKKNSEADKKVEAPNIQSVKNITGRKVTASWKKVPGVTGYQICYSTSKKWKSGKQKLTRKNKFTVKKLKKKKTYYFRVRAYKVIGGRKVYSKWSRVKKIRVKK